MTKRHMLMTVLATALFLQSAPGVSSVASAQDVLVTGPLAGAPAVRHMRIYRQGRLQLTPFTGFTLQNPHQRSVLVGANLGYHFLDWLGVSAVFGYGVAGIDTNLTREIASQGVTSERNRLNLPSREGFPDQVASLDWMGAIQINFVPLRGKLALFQKAFIDADFHIFGGVAFVGISERANTSDEEIAADACAAMGAAPGCAPSAAALNDAYLASQQARASRVATAATFGAGLSMYFTDWFGLNIEWRGLPFAWNSSGTDEAGDPAGPFPDGQIDSNDRIFQFNHIVSIGLIFNLPPTARISD